MSKVLVICLDGCGPDYLASAETPTLDSLAKGGVYLEVQAVVPTVTNVNNVSIVTTAYPKDHGITGNFFLDNAGREQYMESPDLILCPNVFQRLAKQGGLSAHLTVKDKLRVLIGAGATVSISAENPPGWLVDRLGPPPPVYSLEVGHWLVMALRELLRFGNQYDFIYLATSDYPQHKYAPQDEQAQWYLSKLDELLGEVISEAGELEVVVTADHGMNAKSQALDPARLLARERIQAKAIPIIKDRYVAHHSNMGGAAYVYLADPEAISEAIGVLSQQVGIDAVLTREEAVGQYHLYPERIGDLFLLAGPDIVFGDLERAEMAVDLRSHGSLYERTVPLIAWGRQAAQERYAENKDAIRWFFETALREKP